VLPLCRFSVLSTPDETTGTNDDARACPRGLAKDVWVRPRPRVSPVSLDK